MRNGGVGKVEGRNAAHELVDGGCADGVYEVDGELDEEDC